MSVFLSFKCACTSTFALQRGMVGSHGVIGLVDSPSMLTQNVTTASIFKALSREEYAKASFLATACCAEDSEFGVRGMKCFFCVAMCCS